MALLSSQIAALPLWNGAKAKGDWLISVSSARAGVYRGSNANEIVLANGLLARRFRLYGDTIATVGLDDLRSGTKLLRGVKPEAELTIEGKAYPVGGASGQPDLAFLTEEWLSSLRPVDSPFKFTGFEVGKPAARLPWKKVRHSQDMPWPPKGVALTLWFEGLSTKVGVHYELYDGLPVMSKWITVENRSGAALRLNTFKSEILRWVEPESVVDTNPDWMLPNVTVATDYSFGGMAVNNSNRTVYWEADPEYTTQVSYELKTPCVMEVRPPLGPDVDVAAGETFQSFRAFELFHDSTDRERKGLGVRRMFRAMAPWTTENPLMLHLTSTDKKVVRTAIDQAAECGFEMVIISFWSGLVMEDISPANIALFREFREYANSKGLEFGGYSLLASRTIDAETDVISPKTGKPGGAIFGSSPCLCSEWGLDYFRKVKHFLTETGFQLLEHDGSYPGDVCASTKHLGHRGLEDSQWRQYAQISDLYRWCRERGMYLNIPDNYFLAGSNKTAMGYRESNWSLPREQQHVHARQNLYDGTWEKTPSMGWMFVPLVEYQGGGDAATIEPLKDHLVDYELHLANNFGYGVQACYRGHRLYDAPETKAAVVKWVKWFKKYRRLLESDVIHVRRADGVNLDAVLHVDPVRKEAMAVFYNPTDREMEQEIELPLYYSGLTDDVKVAERNGRARTMKLDREYRIRMKVKVPAKGCNWAVIRRSEG